jgi:hypothetical protein
VIVRFQHCVGIKVFRLFNWQLEVWSCPTGETIPLHFHKSIKSRIFHLFGRMIWRLGEREKAVGFSDFGWSKIVPAGSIHGATALTFCVFANLEKWSSSPTSAAVDFFE